MDRKTSKGAEPFERRNPYDEEPEVADRAMGNVVPPAGVPVEPAAPLETFRQSSLPSFGAGLVVGLVAGILIGIGANQE